MKREGVTMPRGRPIDAILALAERCPERALVAAVIRLAVEDCLTGDPEAHSWLAGPDCEEWLGMVVPRGVDGEAVQAALIRAVDDDFRLALAARRRRQARARRLTRRRRPAAPARLPDEPTDRVA